MQYLFCSRFLWPLPLAAVASFRSRKPSVSSSKFSQMTFSTATSKHIFYSFGEGYLTKSFTGGMHGPLGTAKDLTFVSVLDKDGRPLRHASTVEVWNTQKNNIKTYPIINGGEQVTSKTDNYAIFTNATGHLGHAETRQRRDFILTSDDHETIESGDRVTLVDRQGKESPVLVRILRAVTPKTFSARLARSRWKSPPDAYDKEPPRIFEIVREDHGDGRQAVTLVSVAVQHCAGLQRWIMMDDLFSLLHTKRGCFRHRFFLLH